MDIQRRSSFSATYDAHGRQSSQTDNLTGVVTTFGFNAADQVTNTTVTAPGLPAQSTTSEFDELGRVWRTVLPDNTCVTNEYHPTGELKKTSGSRTYPVEYTYDYAGRMKTLKTWQSAGDESTAAVTTWNYDPQRGWLTGKVYADPNSWVGYTASPAGRPATRTWARGVTTTYGYNAAGDLATVHYSDSTPGITNQYDRLGRLTQVQQGASTLTRLFDLAGNLLSESHSGGPLNGLTLTNTFDYFLRRASVSFNTQPAAITHGFGYDAASRLAGVSAGSVAAGYSYLASAPLVQHTYFTNNGSRIMTTTKAYDGLNRLTKIETLNSQPTTLNSFGYGYNAANQRTSVTNHESAYWNFGYDELGQVTNGWRFWNGGTRVAGQQFEYAFDDIGNREPHAPTKAPVVPMSFRRWNSFSATNASRIEAKLAYVTLNNQTPCPPRGAVPVHQGCGRRFFHSPRPDRFRSWLRLFQLWQAMK